MNRRLLIALVMGAFALVGFVLVDRRGNDPATGTVTLLGDSLNVGIEPYLSEELDGWEISSHNAVGRRTEEGIAELRALGGAIAPVLVVSLGTNDLDGESAAFAGQVERLLQLAGPRRCVVWATIWAGGPQEDFNTALRDAAGRHGNLELLDWAALVEDEPELVASDGVHGSVDGYARRAEETAIIARRCRPTG